MRNAPTCDYVEHYELGDLDMICELRRGHAGPHFTPPASRLCSGRVHGDPLCRCWTDRPHTCGPGWCRMCEQVDPLAATR